MAPTQAPTYNHVPEYKDSSKMHYTYVNYAMLLNVQISSDC